MGKFTMNDILNAQSRGTRNTGADGDTNANAATGEFTRIPLENIKPSLKNKYSLDGIDDLAASIESLGLLHNLVVREADEDGKFELISGERRYRALSKLFDGGHAEFETVPCKVEPGDNDALNELRLIHANSTARVLTDYEKANQAARTMELLRELKGKGYELKGRLRDIAAEMLNVSAGQMSRFENINNNLNEALKAEFENGNIGITEANDLARLTEEQQAELAEEIKDKGEDGRGAAIRAATEKAKWIETREKKGCPLKAACFEPGGDKCKNAHNLYEMFFEREDADCNEHRCCALCEKDGSCLFKCANKIERDERDEERRAELAEIAERERNTANAEAGGDADTDGFEDDDDWDEEDEDGEDEDNDENEDPCYGCEYLDKGDSPCYGKDGVCPRDDILEDKPDGNDETEPGEAAIDFQNRECPRKGTMGCEYAAGIAYQYENHKEDGCEGCCWNCGMNLDCDDACAYRDDVPYEDQESNAENVTEDKELAAGTVTNEKTVELNIAVDWKNDDKRKAWLRTYKNWGVYDTAPKLGLTFYRFDLPDSTKAIIAAEHKGMYSWMDENKVDEIYTSFYLKKKTELDKGQFNLTYNEGETPINEELKTIKTNAANAARRAAK